MNLINSKILVILLLSISCGFSDKNDDLESLMHPDLDQLDFDNYVNKDELNSDYWIKNAQNVIADKIKQKTNTKKAKNIIFFLGDGMSVHTLTATRAYLGDVSKQLSFEKFPYVGLTKTYCVDTQVADSACSATAYLTGVKNNIDMIGVTGAVKTRECDEEIVKKKSCL